ncbi:serine hydrolase [Deinococcus aquaticus]|uniref:Serine hydrolase n=1 Tax=Deinococcus aquaticus TaxID=328692 RepID=A0ABY7V054_9DEIO|nr:serine hydrolase [Deinococcus aquaticus]WDA57307.1 serine hydrolase [Deinococcus aquaticus]
MRPTRPAVLLSFSLLTCAQAQAPLGVLEAVTRLFSGPVQAAWLAPDFQAALSAAQLQTALDGLRAQLGAFRSVETQGGVAVAVFEKGRLGVQAALDDQGRFTGLRFTPLVANADATGAGSPRELLKRIFSGPLDPALFAPAFLEALPEAQLRSFLEGLRAQYGPLQDVQVSATGATLIFENGPLNVTQFTLDAQGRVTGLVVAPVTPDVTFGSPDEARAAFDALPGQVSLLVQEVGVQGGAPVIALNAARPLAVGSTFKLAILGELQAQISAGQRAWTDELTLTDADRSLPSGTLQDAPTGSRYTLRDLAARMISQSDNTATDLLLNAVGRAGVEARLGQNALPGTREAFALKNPANAALLAEYRAAVLNVPARRAVLERARVAPLPAASAFAGGPLARDVEWFASTGRLCRLMGAVVALKETQLNPGVADPAAFGSVSFKGGNEPGVLNLTTQVTTQAGRTYCVSATWNDARALNDPQFLALYGGVLRLLR